MQPDRILFGCESNTAAGIIHELYEGIPAPVYVTDRRSAELTKYTANAFLSMKISFANMIADLSEAYGADIRKVMLGVGSDRRIGNDYLQAGIGYGGSCFPKDLQALLAAGGAIGYPLSMLQATVSVNESRIPRLFEKLVSELGNPSGKRISIYGLSYKPMTNDLRDAPSLRLLKQCLDAGMIVQVYDPVIRQLPIHDVQIMNDPYAAALNADALVIVTEWPQFEELNWQIIFSMMNKPFVVDGRNLLSDETIEILLQYDGAIYMPIGRSMLRNSQKPVTLQI
jgi:UDPglucose 6-dehydrogenase